MKTLLSQKPITGPVYKGVVPTFTAKGKHLEDRSAKLIHWSRSTRAGITGEAPDSVWLADIQRAELEAAREKMREGLPELKRTSGREKTRVLAKELWNWIQEAMTATHGQWTPPKSLMGKIVEDSWKQGDPITYDDCYQMAMKQLERTRIPQMVPDVHRGTWDA